MSATTINSYSISFEYVDYKAGNDEAIGKLLWIHKSGLTREQAWSFIKSVEKHADAAEHITLDHVVVRDRPCHIVWNKNYR